MNVCRFVYITYRDSKRKGRKRTPHIPAPAIQCINSSLGTRVERIHTININNTINILTAIGKDLKKERELVAHQALMQCRFVSQMSPSYGHEGCLKLILSASRPPSGSFLLIGPPVDW